MAYDSDGEGTGKSCWPPAAAAASGHGGGVVQLSDVRREIYDCLRAVGNQEALSDPFFDCVFEDHDRLPPSYYIDLDVNQGGGRAVAQALRRRRGAPRHQERHRAGNPAWAPPCRTNGSSAAPCFLQGINELVVFYKPSRKCGGFLQLTLLVLSRRGVRILDISGFLTLPSSVFTCSRLTSLLLFFCTIPLLPLGFEGLPELSELTLNTVDLQENSQYQLEEIIATSPLLEVLSLRDVNIPGEFKQRVIQGPNLGFLQIDSLDDYGWDLGDLPRLDSADIDIWDYLADRDFSKFLSSLASITKLQISTYDEPLNGANILETLPCTFINLKILTLLTRFCELPSILSTFCLLRNDPDLESLKIQVVCDYDYGMGHKFEANGEFQNAQFIDGMCANLQFVDMTSIHLFSNEMSFIEVILSKARLHSTLSISLGHGLRHGVELAMSAEDGLKKLLNHKKASTHAEVIFEDYFLPWSLEMHEAVPLEWHSSLCSDHQGSRLKIRHATSRKSPSLGTAVVMCSERNLALFVVWRKVCDTIQCINLSCLYFCCRGEFLCLNLQDFSFRNENFADLALLD